MRLLLFFSLFLLCYCEDEQQLKSSSFITILVTSHKSPTCGGKSTAKRTCRYVTQDSINHCSPMVMQMWSWNGPNLQLSTFWDPFCKYFRSAYVYSRGCRQDVYGKNYELTQFLSNHHCYDDINFYRREDEIIDEKIEKEGSLLSIVQMAMIPLIVIPILIILSRIIYDKLRTKEEDQKLLSEQNQIPYVSL
jgi:hypothetical protein